MSLSEITAVNQQFEAAARSQDLDGLAALYTADAMVLPPDGPIVKGRQDIKQMWGMVAQQLGLKEVRLRTVSFEREGSLGHEVGEATLAVATGTLVVKYIVVWKKTDGQWRIHRDIWNSAPVS
jgi:uncharacterized protein (TIGR02246 family)